MDNKRNYYRLLHVQFDAPSTVIKSSYRSMMQKLRMHPDLGGDEDYAKLLNEAMSILLDKEKRAEYDRSQKSNIYGQRPRQGPLSGNKNADEVVKEQDTTIQKLDNPVNTGFCLFCNSLLVTDVVNAYTLPDVFNNECAVCKAPTQKVGDYPHSTKKKIRALQRVAYDLSTDVKLNSTGEPSLQMDMQDFSIQGACLISVDDVPTEQRILILSDYVKAVSEVKYSHQNVDGSWRLGVKFYTLKLTIPKGELISVKY